MHGSLKIMSPTNVLERRISFNDLETIKQHRQASNIGLNLVTARSFAQLKESHDDTKLRVNSDMMINQDKILIVDDQIFNIKALLIILEHSIGIDCNSVCYKATSGKQALKIIQDNIQYHQQKFHQ